MGFPTREKICTALLAYIYQNGGEKHAVIAGKSYEPLADRLGLSPSDRTVSRMELYGDRQRSEPAWHSMVQYARRDLVKRGLIARDAGIGIWMLTPEGISAAEQVERPGHLPSKAPRP
jgi:hypothetical protein